MDKLNVNIGDKVIVTDRWNGRFVSTVEKVTPKGNIRVDGILYNEYGNEKGANMWGGGSIDVATPEKLEEIRQKDVIKEAFKAMKSTGRLSYSKAVKILEILKEEN